MADAIETATAEFLKKYPITRDKYRISPAMDRHLEEICRRHGTPYRTVRKIVIY